MNTPRTALEECRQMVEQWNACAPGITYMDAAEKAFELVENHSKALSEALGAEVVCYQFQREVVQFH